MKTCSKCGVEKEFGEFYKSEKNKSGFSSWCKACNKKSHKAWVGRNKNHLKEYVLSNRNKINESCKKSREKNKDSLSEIILRKRVQEKQKIITIVKNKIFKETTKRTKGMWDGVGKWSREYNECVECLTTVYIFEAKGMCTRCYHKLRREANHEEISKRTSELYRINIEKNREINRKRYKKRKSLFQKAQSGEIEIDAETQNAIDNYERI